jgi:hypothetical protein
MKLMQEYKVTNEAQKSCKVVASSWTEAMATMAVLCGPGRYWATDSVHEGTLWADVIEVDGMRVVIDGKSWIRQEP